MKFLKWFGITIGIIVVILVVGLGYMGFIPGVSDLFGSNKPKDLGITYTAADYASARTKVGTTLSVLPSGDPTQSLKFTGSHPVNVNFTQAEYTALLNERLWTYYPLDNVQVRLNPDGTAELSATILKDRIQGCLEALGGNQEALDTVTSYMKYIPTNPSVYMNGTVEIENGQFVNTSITSIKIGNIDLTGQIKDNMASIINGAESAFTSIPGFTVKTFKIQNGQIHFEGTEPDCARSILTP